MKASRLSLILFAATVASVGCAASSQQAVERYLSEDEVINLMQNPEEWDERVVTVRIYPYDNGYVSSYIVCFERCDEAYAESSPYIVMTRPQRFAGFRGDRAVIITARYSSSCFYRDPLPCVHFRYGQFTEIER
jgi:hypothetical protein